jgi:hypothetical protein
MDKPYKKQELVEWLSKLEEPRILYQISKLKEESEKETEFDFDKEFENGYTPEEFKEEMFKRIKAYPWKK